MATKKTKFLGVFYRLSKKYSFEGKPDQIWYIVYRADNRVKWEKVGQSSQGMTAVKAAQIRNERVLGQKPQNKDLNFEEAFEIAYERHLSNYVMKKQHLAFNREHCRPLFGQKKL
ncbi:MAG: hypothetical protein LBT38_00455, partial [Deltaproteobacteria bacterium]|nr:hypothetical protein [Deltaproteobacteria bacterium]